MAEYTCIVCPLSCHLTVSEGQDGTISVSGNGCKRGEEHGKNEYLNPMRMITSTVAVLEKAGCDLPWRGAESKADRMFRGNLSDSRKSADFLRRHCIKGCLSHRR